MNKHLFLYMLFDIDFQKQILFNSAFLESSQLCSLVNEMNRGDYVMVDRILGQDCDKTFTPEEIIEAFNFSDSDGRDKNIKELYILAPKKVQQKCIYKKFKKRLAENLEPVKIK